MAIIMRIINNEIVKLLIDGREPPKLKGRPRRKRKKRSVSPGESSNESEASVASSAAASTSKGSSSSSGQSSAGSAASGTSSSAVAAAAAAAVKRNDRKPTAEEKKFVSDVHTFMSSRNTPLGKMPLLGYRQIDLFLFYTKVQDLGGYDRVSANRLWKTIYDELGGNTGSTSAATITRRHYERLLLPYERCQKGEESKVKPNQAGRRTKTPSISDASEDGVEVKRETESPPPSETSSPTETSNSTAATPPPPLQSILSTSPFLPGEKPRAESGKTSSLRSVRVKPERLKSLNTIIATSNAPPASQQQLPTSPSLLTAAPTTTTTTTTTTTSASTNTVAASTSSGASSPTSTPPASTTPTNSSVLERQLNSPLVTQQVPPSCSPPGLPVSTVATNATTVVTLTPPPEKDMKEIKLDPKQTSLLAQGKENIPLFEEKSPMFADKPPMVAPRSPEVIDLETESESGTRDKLIIPSFKKRKLEILREGGLEVTAVELDSRPSVIQPTATTAGVPMSVCTTTTSSSSASASPSPLATGANGASTSPVKQEEKPPASPFSLPIPKLINVTMTPELGHSMSRSEEGRSPRLSPSPIKQQPQLAPTSQSSNGTPTSQASPVNSRVINLGNSSNNATLLQLYANANMPMPHSVSPVAQANQRFVPPIPAPVTNGRPLPKVTQSRSIFGNSERTVYGNPKEIILAPKFLPPVLPHPHAPRTPSSLPPPPTGMSPRCDPVATGVLDLTQKSTPAPERPSMARPNLEIVRVPVVPRPTPLNLEVRNHDAHRRGVIGTVGSHKDMNSMKPQQSMAAPQPPSDPTRKNQFVTGSVAPNPAGYPGMIDSRTMATNNLEITLVSPKKSSSGSVGLPQPSPPMRPNNNVMPPQLPMQRRPPPPQQPHPPQHHLNGKYPTRMPAEPVSPYTPRKPSGPSGGSSSSSVHHPVIPNVPNLSHLNSSATANYGKPSHPSYQQLAMERRKTPIDALASREQHRRISEGDKVALQQQQQQQQQHRLEAASKPQQSRESEASRRHSVPSLPTGFMPALPPGNPAFLAHQLAAANNGTSPAAAAAAAAAAAGKFLPILDPYYSAFYNGLFPGPMAPNTAPSPFLPPEFSAYYKELLASSSAQQTRLAMAAGQQHQPAAPTSK